MFFYSCVKTTIAIKLSEIIRISYFLWVPPNPHLTLVLPVTCWPWSLRLCRDCATLPVLLPNIIFFCLLHETLVLLWVLTISSSWEPLVEIWSHRAVKEMCYSLPNALSDYKCSLVHFSFPDFCQSSHETRGVIRLYSLLTESLL